MLFGLLATSIGTVEKARLAGESATGFTPVPARLTGRGPLGELLITVTSPPEVAPVAVGANMIPILQLVFPASDPLTVPPEMGHVVFAVLVSRMNGPAKTNWVMLSDADCRLSSVTVLVALWVPITTCPKLIEVGETIVGCDPVPDSVMDCGLPLALKLMAAVPTG